MVGLVSESLDLFAAYSLLSRPCLWLKEGDEKSYRRTGGNRAGRKGRAEGNVRGELQKAWDCGYCAGRYVVQKSMRSKRTTKNPAK